MWPLLLNSSYVGANGYDNMIKINKGTKTRNNFGVSISFEVFRNLKWETRASLSDFQFDLLILSKLFLIISVKLFHLILWIT